MNKIKDFFANFDEFFGKFAFVLMQCLNANLYLKFA